MPKDKKSNKKYSTAAASGNKESTTEKNPSTSSSTSTSGTSSNTSSISPKITDLKHTSMNSHNNNIDKTTSSSTSSTSIKNESNKKPPQKIFGLMTKRRWFGVAIFLLGILWSYTAGPPLSSAHISCQYYKDSIAYDYNTVTKEGNQTLINLLFKPLLFPDTFTWQIGSFFQWTQAPVWYENRLLFSDVVTNQLFSWSKYTGIQIESNHAVDLDTQTLSKLAEPGIVDMIIDPKHEHHLYIAEQGTRRIIRKNVATNQTTIIASTFEGKKLNSPHGLTLDIKNNYLYFIDNYYGLYEKSNYDSDNLLLLQSLKTKSDLGYNGLYRINLNTNNYEMELINQDIEYPNGIIYNENNQHLYISNCQFGMIDIYVYQIESSNQHVKLIKHWINEKDLQWNGNSIHGGVGCTGGFALHPKGYLFVSCPGGKICIINESNDILEAVIKMPDHVKLSNLLIANDYNLYLTGNHSNWQIRLESQFF